MDEHGDSSWEVDALPPDALQRIVRAEFSSVVDKSMMNAVKKQEEEDKKLLRSAVEHLRKKKDGK